MKLKLLLLGILLLSVSSVNTFAQNDSVLSFSLTEAQNYALENYFLSKNSALDIEIARKQILETTAIGLPQVSASADYQHIPDLPPPFPFQMGDTVVNIEFAQQNNTTYGFTVSQLIFSGEYFVGLQAARVYRIYSEENYEKIKIDLKEGIAGSYYTLLVLESNKEVLEKTLLNLQSNLNEMEKIFQAGLTEDSEVDQIELTVKRTESDLATLENQLEYMRKMFKYQLGVGSEEEIELSDSLEALIETTIISDSTNNFILEENIDYKMLETNEKLQKLSLQRERTTYLPVVTGFYRYSDQTSSTEFSPTINHVLGISATWNIFQSGLRHAKVSQAKIALEQAQNIKEQEAQRLILDAQQATFNYQTALRKYYNEKLNFELSEKVLDKTSTKHKQGMVSSLELSITNTQFLSAQITYSTAVQNLLAAKIALDKAYNKL